MADTTVNTSVNALHYRRSVRAGPVWISPSVGYVFLDAGNELAYQKTSDGGATWASAVTINSGNPISISVWYDKWTPVDRGALIHIAYTEADNDDVFYRNLDTSDDSLSTEATVFAGVSFVNGNWDEGTIDIVKSRGGNLYIAFWGDASGEYGFYRSIDGGTTWVSRANVADGNEADGVLLMPGNETDGDDILCVYWDRSADELSLKTYDNSGDSWSETSIATSMADSAVYYQMAAVPRHTDNHTILMVWSELDTATADLRVWDIEDNSSITAMTDVVSNLAESAGVAVLINQQNSDIYVAYLKGGTWQATVDVKYKKSTDGGTTWGDETSYSEASADDIRALWAGISIGDEGGNFQPMFYNHDLADMFVNLVNDVRIAASANPQRAANVGATVDAIPSHGSAKA